MIALTYLLGFICLIAICALIVILIEYGEAIVGTLFFAILIVAVIYAPYWFGQQVLTWCQGA